MKRELKGGRVSEGVPLQCMCCCVPSASDIEPSFACVSESMFSLCLLVMWWPLYHVTCAGPAGSQGQGCNTPQASVARPGMCTCCKRLAGSLRYKWFAGACKLTVAGCTYIMCRVSCTLLPCCTFPLLHTHRGSVLVWATGWLTRCCGRHGYTQSSWCLPWERSTQQRCTSACRRWCRLRWRLMQTHPNSPQTGCSMSGGCGV